MMHKIRVEINDTYQWAICRFGSVILVIFSSHSKISPGGHRISEGEQGSPFCSNYGIKGFSRNPRIVWVG